MADGGQLPQGDLSGMQGQPPQVRSPPDKIFGTENVPGPGHDKGVRGLCGGARLLASASRVWHLSARKTHPVEADPVARGQQRRVGGGSGLPWPGQT